MRNLPKLRTPLLIVAEALLIFFAMVVTAYLRLGWVDAYFELSEKNGYLKAGVVTAFCLTAFYLYDLYDFVVMHDQRELVLRLVQALGLAWVALAIAIYLAQGLLIGHGVSLIALPLALALMVGWRVGAHWLLSQPSAVVNINNRLVSLRNNRISKAPGALLLLIVDFFYSSKTVEETFKPIIADWRIEYFEALNKRRRYKACWISIRYTYCFILSMGLSKLYSVLNSFLPTRK